MFAVVVFGSLTGLLLPIALHRFGFDPAAAGAPLITSLADIGGIVIYFSIARAWLAPG
jgi:magnesium transporter